jgi:exonuclease SbcC
MTRLRSLVIENFRSIRGEISVSLDAPVVLIHGQNGSGKTSLLSALELALTRTVPSLQRADPDYLQHLPHKLAEAGAGRVLLEAEIGERDLQAKIGVSAKSISGNHLLDAKQTKFFGDRCFLAQSTLTRLLELYQHQDSRKSDSPLTKFVKELLGLDRLDALIDGLRPVGDVRRLRDPVPAYWDARQELPNLQKELNESRAELQSKRATLADLRGKIGDHLQRLGTPTLPSLDDAAALSAFLSTRQDEQVLAGFARMRRDIVAIAERWPEVAVRPGEEQRRRLQLEQERARQTFESWRAASGGVLLEIAKQLEDWLGTASWSTLDPVPLWSAMTDAVARELARIASLSSSDAAGNLRAAELRRSVAQSRQRVADLDNELLQLTGQNQQLAQALSALIPHVHADDCPVCGRNYKEVSPLPLQAHLSSRINELVQAASRLQALSRDKASSLSVIATADREIAVVSGRLLTQAARDELKTRGARFLELQQTLISLKEPAAVGQGLLENLRIASRAMAAVGEGDQAANAIKEQLNALGAQLGFDEASAGAEIAQVISSLSDEIGKRDASAVQQLSTKHDIAMLQAQTLELGRVIALLVDDIERAESAMSRIEHAKGAADHRITLARNLARQLRDARTDIVRKVFNEDLNKLWRDLFIRLAPDEPFIPAFALPASSAGPVEAQLETLYRRGGKGGNPRAMLSAGNLNTAALTLFLSLHLSVAPSLPWLVIDDPVQSMDEVHIAQFAALLRNLAKVQRRQVILAVHERPLFDYLALELSPAFQGDRLITIELTRSSDGSSNAVWLPKVFEPDRAIAA